MAKQPKKRTTITIAVDPDDRLDFRKDCLERNTSMTQEVQALVKRRAEKFRLRNPLGNIPKVMA